MLMIFKEKQLTQSATINTKGANLGFSFGLLPFNKLGRVYSLTFVNLFTTTSPLLYSFKT